MGLGTRLGMYVSMKHHLVILSSGNVFISIIILCLDSGILELLEYSPATVSDEDVKAFEEAQKLDFEKQVCIHACI